MKAKTTTRNKRALKCAARLAIAALSIEAGSAAHAQSSVTFFGAMDLSVGRISSSGGGSRTGLSSGQSTPSRFGFRGQEDLGGGLSAGFWLEGEVFGDTGTTSANGQFFNRRSTVSLAGNFGEVRLGRDFSPSYLNSAIYDPFNNRGAVRANTYNNFADTVRNSNSVAYFLPANLGGFFGTFQYAFGEANSNSPNDKQGNYYGGRVGYAGGPLNVAVAAGQYKQLIGSSNVAPVTIGNDLQIANIGGSYDFGIVKFFGVAGQEKIKDGPVGASKVNSAYLAATIPTSNGSEWRASYGHYDTKDSSNDWQRYGVGYLYSLSKRTQLYANVGLLKNRSGSTHNISVTNTANIVPRPGGSGNGFDLGIRHVF